MRVLITGATGLVGKAIVGLCHENKWDVNYLTTQKSKIRNKENYRGFYWDPGKGIADDNCLEDVDAIINLAGVTIAKRWTASYRKKIVKSRKKSIEVLHKILSDNQHKVKKFISASAIGIYPHSYTNYYDEEVKETDDSFLGEVVRKWESAADKIGENGITVIKVRLGMVLSYEGGALPQFVKPIKNFVGAVLGNGEQWQSWIHIDDAAEIFIHLLKTGEAGIYNAVAPNPVTNHKLTYEIAHILKKNIVLPNVPAGVLRLMFGSMSYMLLSSQRVSAKKIEDTGYNFIFSSVQPALEDLLYAKKGQLREELA